MKPIFSIIIPVYNAEKHLSKTLESVENQCFTDFEVLLVDDGSTDSSTEICSSFADKDSRFILYKKSNGGVCSARNLGIRHANGEFVVFIDSDDVIEDSLLTDALRIISDSNADVLLFGMQFDIEKQGRICKTIQKRCDTCEFDITELDKHYRALYENNYITSMCNRVTRLSLIKNQDLRFDERITNYEDMAFSLACLRYAQKVYVSEKSYYHYILHEELGMSRKYKPHLTETLHSTVELLLNNIRALSLDEATEKWACCDVQRILWLGVANICRKNESMAMRRNDIRELCTESWVKELLPIQETGNKYNDICVLFYKKRLWLAETMWNVFANFLRDLRY